MHKTLLGSTAIVGSGLLLLAACEPQPEANATNATAEPAAERPVAPQQDTLPAEPGVEQQLAGWPQEHQEVAREMMEQYGEPDQIGEHRIIWQNSGPWNETVIFREEVQHDFPMPHPDFMTQSIDYDVPPEMFSELARFTGSIYPDRTAGTLTAKCDKEGPNFLSVNLANDIIAGERTVEEARDFYADAIQRDMDGEEVPYMMELQFEPHTDTGDPDQAVM